MAKDEKQNSSIYNVLSLLKHGGKHFPKGKTVELTPKEAAPLLKCGTVEAAK